MVWVWGGALASQALVAASRSSSSEAVLAGEPAATREPERFGLKDFSRFLTFGASPRATIHLIEGARALAFLRGRTYALPQDVMDLVPDVLRHRLVLSYEALAEGQTPDMLVNTIMQHVRAPDKPLETHVKVANA